MNARRATVAAAAWIATLLLIALGIWQLERREWKHALICRVEARIAAAPVAVPPRAAWPTIGRDDDYRVVTARGRYLANAETRTQATTVYGAGSWLLTPLATGKGTILVNRGFVPAGVAAAPPPTGTASVIGLLRASERGGNRLHSNRPDQDRWYSRDTAAIARRRGIGPVAPFFIDARGSGRGWPRGGLTVVRFADNHLVYAITWFTLAGLAGWFAMRLTIAARAWCAPSRRS